MIYRPKILLVGNIYNSHPGQGIKNFTIKFNNISTITHLESKLLSILGQDQRHKYSKEAYVYTKPEDSKLTLAKSTAFYSTPDVL